MMKPRTVSWTVFKQSGKWAYSGVSTFLDEDSPVDRAYRTPEENLKLVADNQTEVYKELFTNGDHYVVIDGWEEEPDNRFQFMSHLYMPVNK